MPSETVLARIAEFLESIWTHPAAAAQFVESPDTALASHNLSQSDLQGVDLQSVAGGLQGSGGMSPEGKQVLIDFASGPAPHHGSAVQHIGNVTRNVHHDNPVVQKTFVDNSQTFNIDNSQHFVNNGSISGDVTFDSDVNVATGHGVIVGDNSQAVVASGTGSVANTGEGGVVQAKDSVVAQGGNGGTSGDGRDPGNGRAEEGQSQGEDGHGDKDHGDQDHGEDQSDQEHGDKNHGDGKGEDLSFGDGDHKDQHDQKDQKDEHDQHGEQDQPDLDHRPGAEPTAAEEVPGHPGEADGHDPTAPQADPTLVEGHEDGTEAFQQGDGQDGGHDPDGHHDPGADHLVDA